MNLRSTASELLIFILEQLDPLIPPIQEVLAMKDTVNKPGEKEVTARNVCKCLSSTSQFPLNAS